MLTVGSVVIRVDDLPGEIAFWTAALDYAAREPVGDGFALLHPRDLCADDQDAEVRRLEALGACRVHGDKQPPDADDIIMEDPEGNRFCVVAAGEAGHAHPPGVGEWGTA
ncbi:hypothetical protein HMPREF1529_01469 [Microbacterium sp. oral taxon 186 str. F0373]|uniref:VOC family protein n=1 Tax=Microbacterium sp. oral taxon 186 TaxID=712383 RepID=UPI00034E7A0A|nr:VOC family protein [Microbacterium sp. oral taxon 186]EPD84863.1 hypothetical protein HMPREF1529_01469 [Microbacterium sp. oral taxon 186 str. F0373]